MVNYAYPLHIICLIFVKWVIFLLVDANLVKYSQEKLCGGKPSAWWTQKRFIGVYSVMFGCKTVFVV